MTPAQTYAQKREEAVELIRAHAPTRLQDALIELLRPAIALSATRADDAEIPIGASKFGGAPDVPGGFEWPMWNDKPLGFLAQINLEEVAPFDVENLLPKRGVLSFFYDFDSMSWGFIEDQGAWRVIHFAEAELTRGHEKTSEIVNRGMSFHLRFELPNRESLDFNVGRISEEEEKQYRDLSYLLDPFGHKLWGYGFGIQGNELQETCQLSCHGRNFGSEDAGEYLQNAGDWRLLFQLDSDPKLEMSWGDQGLLYFFIRQQDLATADFQNCWIQLQCL